MIINVAKSKVPTILKKTALIRNIEKALVRKRK